MYTVQAATRSVIYWLCMLFNWHSALNVVMFSFYSFSSIVKISEIGCILHMMASNNLLKYFVI
jgi:hypothetical protein